MPVTVKLSRKFYEKFGDDVANELVELVNSVDTSYRTELREMNELNFARFEAKLEQRIGDLRAEMREVKAELIKWTFVFVTGGTLTVLSVLIAVLKL
jgi:hypothetical protein